MNRYLPLIVFLVLVLGGGLLLGSLTVPGGWFAGLAKPWFNPPGWLFAPVWTVLYVFIAVAGWRVWRLGQTSRIMQLWWLQLALNFMWTPIFFGAHQIGLALAVILALLAVVIGFIAATLKVDRVAAWLFAPYAAWVAFASLLNGSIWMLN